jgi:large subunit ribosomal protein L5
MSRLQEFYRDTVIKNLMATGSFKNVMDVPRITKITINMGLGEAIGDKKILESALGDMQKISGQKPVTTLARKSVASFKVRDGYPIGCKVTLRSKKMYEFLDRLISISIPRERDFRGLNPKSFDGRGNYNMGIKEQIIFPEIEYEKIDKIRGMDICITTTAKDNESGLALLKEFNFPFRGVNKQGSK